MQHPVTIRKASVDDITIIHRLAHLIWPLTYNEILSQDQLIYMLHLLYSPDSLREQFKNHQFLLAVLNEDPVGFASFSRSTEPDVYKLHKLYVRTDIQGKGIGKALIDHILGELRSHGVKALDLNVNRHNKARSFYEKLGFTVTREEDIDIGNNYWMNDYVMRINLQV